MCEGVERRSVTYFCTVLSALLCLVIIALLAMYTEVKSLLNKESDFERQTHMSEVNILLNGKDSEFVKRAIMTEKGKGYCEHLNNCNFHTSCKETNENLDSIIFVGEPWRKDCNSTRNSSGLLIQSPSVQITSLSEQRYHNIDFIISYFPRSSFKLGIGKFVKLANRDENWRTSPQRPGVNNVTQIAAVFAEPCPSNSNREGYIRELKKHIRVDVYGNCPNSQIHCPNASVCLDIISLQERYKFILFFEAYICKNYQSDLLWKVLTDKNSRSVPVVFGGVNYEDFLPENSFVDALHQQPKTLAKYLNFLLHHKKAWLFFVNPKRVLSVMMTLI